MKFDIATARTRTAKTWNNKKTTWQDFVDKLRKPHYTHETFAEYLKSDKSRQAEIKDVGGFVAGYLTSGTRKPAFVKHRQVITLDIDFAELNFWDNFTMFFPFTAALYSTHKHSPKTPRYRLLIPLSKPVSGEAYEAISRKVAEDIGMSQFDSTTFQPERLMYWQSTSSDGIYEFQEQEGEILDPDNILDQYVDWKDFSAWPLCDNEREVIKLGGNKQEDPTTKPGMIGAFCRAYTIHDAITEFIPDDYEACGDNRYTYIGGETEGGAIVYGDIYIYSHHNSDPAHGMLCNAFDMVRIHKFGYMDKNRDDIKDTTKLPSYGEMMQMLNSNPEVIRELGIFNDLPAGEWLVELEYNAKGTILKPTINNLLLIMRNDPNLDGAFGYNRFDYRDYVMRPVPWNLSGEVRQLGDADDAGLRHYLENKYDLFNEKKTRDAIDMVLKDNAFHPVRDYLGSLSWDGTPRIERLFIDAMGAADTDYVKNVTRKALCAAVARIYQPGVKFDHVLTLQGGQGLGKSSILRELGGKWFSDTLGNIQNKEAYEQLHGVWILEMGELAGLRKAEVEVIKHFISKQEDNYRVAYARRTSTFPRQCVFFGTTNEVAFLRDSTGGRRFWPVAVNSKYVHGSVNIDQIWAEAKHLYEAGETLYLADKLEDDARDIQKQHAEGDSWIGIIEKYLDINLPEAWDAMSQGERRSWLAGEAVGDGDEFRPGINQREKVCIAEIWSEVVGGFAKDMTNNNTKSFHAIMQNMAGWERSKTNLKFGAYGYQRAYVRTSSLEKYGKTDRKKVKTEIENIWGDLL